MSSSLMCATPNDEDAGAPFSSLTLPSEQQGFLVSLSGYTYFCADWRSTLYSGGRIFRLRNGYASEPFPTARFIDL